MDLVCLGRVALSWQCLVDSALWTHLLLCGSVQRDCWSSCFSGEEGKGQRRGRKERLSGSIRETGRWRRNHFSSFFLFVYSIQAECGSYWVLLLSGCCRILQIQPYWEKGSVKALEGEGGSKIGTGQGTSTVGRACLAHGWLIFIPSIPEGLLSPPGVFPGHQLWPHQNKQRKQQQETRPRGQWGHLPLGR